MKIFKKYEKSELIPLALLIAVYVVSASMLLLQYRMTKEQLMAEFIQEKENTARFAASELSGFLEYQRKAILNLAGLTSMAGSLEKGKAILQNYVVAYKKKPRSCTFTVMDSRGRFLYSVPEDIEGRYMQDLSGEPFFREASRTREFQNAGAVSDGKGEWSLVMAAPVVSGDGGGKVMGVVAEKVLLTEIAARFINTIGAGKGGYAFLLDESGRVLASGRQSRLYQIESSSDTLGRMLKGEDGYAFGESADTGKEELEVFAPVKFQGRVWAIGIITPSPAAYGEARKNFQRTILIISLMSLVFSWSMVSAARSSRYKAGIIERTKFSEYLMNRNRELSALNNFSRTVGSSEGLDSLIDKAVDALIADAGADGCAVRLFSGPERQMHLVSQRGMPDGSIGKNPCAGPGGCPCRKAAEAGRPAFLRDGRPEDGRGCGAAGGELAIIPLVVKKKTLGLLYIWSAAQSAHPAERENFLTAFGNQLAADIENVQQMEDTKRHAAIASALFNTAQALTRGLAMDDLLGIIMKESAALLKVKRSMLFLYNEEENVLDCRVALGFDEMRQCSLSFNPSGLFWEAIRDGGIKAVNLAEGDQEAPRRFVEKTGLSRFLLVPLLSKGKVLGFMVFETAGKGRQAGEDLKMITGFANQSAVAIETSSFYIRTVEKYNQDLQDLSNRIIAAQEEERKRISRDLHDELGQALTAIKINLDMVNSEIPPGFEGLKARVGDAVSLISSTLDSVRRLSFELRPSMLDDLGLITVLGKLVSDFRKRTGIEIGFEHYGIEERLSQEMEVTLYRVVQEALTNIMKHSGARKVEVVLTHEEDRGIVSLKVEDDGAGIPGQGRKETKGFGLMGIRERVSLLGGNFRIFSQEGSGTKIFIDIPYTKGEQQTWKKA